MRRSLFFVYGVACHLLFVGTFTYMAGFVGNVLVSKSIDSPASGSIVASILINVLLLAMFGVQHSVMARPAFKRVWTRIVPEPIERSTYVLVSCAATFLLMWQWRGIDLVVWNAQNQTLRGLLWGLFAGGWLLVFLSSLLINHFDLFGTRQVWFYLRGREYESLPFRVPSLYKHVRHPLYVGFAIAFWVTPTMTVGHLLFAGVLSGYMGLAALFEERDLIAHFGRQYEDYRRKVPMFIPRWKRSEGPRSGLVVAQRKLRVDRRHEIKKLQPFAAGLGRIQDDFQRGLKVAIQIPLRQVAGCAGLQGGDRELLAAIGGHQHHRNRAGNRAFASWTNSKPPISGIRRVATYCRIFGHEVYSY